MNTLFSSWETSTAVLEKPIQETILTITPAPYTHFINYTPQSYTFKIITDKEEAKNMWNVFANPNILFENWDFLMTFYNEFHHSLQFYVWYVWEKPVGMIPLNFDADTGKLESFFSKKAQHPIFILPGYEGVVNFLLSKIEWPINLEYIYFSSTTDWAPEGFEFQMGLYDLDVRAFESGEAYLQHINASFPSKKRIKYNAEHRKVKEQLSNIVVNRITDIETLFDFNIKAVTMEHYGEVSGFLSERYKNWFRKLLASGFETYLFSFEVDGIVHDIELVLKYGDTLYHLTGATSRQIQNVGKFANLYMIDFAIQKWCSFYNAGTGDYNWKEKLGLKKVNLYKYIG